MDSGRLEKVCSPSVALYISTSHLSNRGSAQQHPTSLSHQTLRIDRKIWIKLEEVFHIIVWFMGASSMQDKGLPSWFLTANKHTGRWGHVNKGDINCKAVWRRCSTCNILVSFFSFFLFLFLLFNSFDFIRIFSSECNALIVDTVSCLNSICIYNKQAASAVLLRATITK